MVAKTAYAPAAPPETADPAAGELARYVYHELQTISRTFQQLSFLQLTVLHVEPPRPREGLFAVADGSDWDPGSGGGPYAYFGGAWRKLST